MKVALVGCGALGGYYGAKLCRAGVDVHFLLRSDFDVVQRRGLRVRSPDGDFAVHPPIAHEPSDIGECDMVVIGLKTTANHQFGRLLPPLLSRHTAILTLQNGLGNEEQLAALFGGDRVLGGLCFVCLNRVQPGVIQHLAHGKIVLGEYRRVAQPRTQNVAELFRRAGIACEVTDDLERAHWEKLVWNIPFNGLGVAGAAGFDAVARGDMRAENRIGSCLTTQQLLAEERWEKLVRELMLEVIATANALGLSVSEATAETQISRTRAMGAYKASTLVDFERGQPLELESLFCEPLRRAEVSGVATPRLSRLCALLRQLNNS